MVTAGDRPREVRIALVLYGGISLAIYENGVTRCFYDLVKMRGVFGVLLDLLDANAVVDVVSGASAGGINGLFLATALESGQEFKDLAGLWRRLGDIAVLLRDPKDADEAQSLMNGEYFHKELIKAFQLLCTPVGGAQSPGEMDVFIAGTDLGGHLTQYLDSNGSVIKDKAHRVVFHLQHRPERKWLGLRGKKTEQSDVDLQGELLGTVARITAGFPIGFEPVAGDSLEATVRDLLDYLSEVDASYGQFTVAGHSLVDGGVLNNKPFGPALRAVFHRMPGGVVDRRLFYVEPDPELFEEEKKKNKDKDKEKSSFSPIAVGVKSLVSVPGHQSIGDDLEALLAHNECIRWLKRLREKIVTEARGTQGFAAPSSPVYLQTRIESICRSLVLNESPVPSVNDYPTDPVKKALLRKMGMVLTGRVEEAPAYINPYDVIYQLRKAFHLLYLFYDKLERGSRSCKTPVLLMGRIIKTLNVIMDGMADLRGKLMAEAGRIGADAIDDAMAGKIFDQFTRFLHKDGQHWDAIRGDLKKAPVTLIGAEKGFLASEVLTATWDQVRRIDVAGLEIRGLPQGPAEPGETILDEIAGIMAAIVNDFKETCGTDDKKIDLFDVIDRELYPSEFVGGIYELDEIEFVRVSPMDAQKGLSKRPGPDKVAGDKLAHFSAFLRRDWRSNDILQGRVDGTCLIIESLLSDDAIERALTRGIGPDVLNDSAAVSSKIPGCTDGQVEALVGSWKELCAQWAAHGEWNEAVKAAAAEFRLHLILAGQEDAVSEDMETIIEDCRYQEIKFGKMDGPTGARASTDDAVIESDARIAMKQDPITGSREAKVKGFQELRMGKEDIAGKDGSLPFHVIGQYLSVAWLMMWGMLRRTGKGPKTFFDKAPAKGILYYPVLCAYYAFALARRDEDLLKTGYRLIIVFLWGVAITALYYSQWLGFVVALIVLFAVFLFVGTILRSVPRKPKGGGKQKKDQKPKKDRKQKGQEAS